MEPQTKHQVLWDGASQNFDEIRAISGVDRVGFSFYIFKGNFLVYSEN